MDRDVKLKHFANALFSSIYREYNTTFELAVKLPQVFSQSEANGCSEEEKKAVLKLCVSFRSVFNGVFAKAFSHIQRSVKHFMTFLTSRCLKLCGDDLFLSFVIICAFISELNLFCCINGCYTFMSTAPRCLTAIFNRRLKREFYARGGWDRLQLFCENFVQMNRKVSDVAEDHANGDATTHHSVKNILHLLEENSSSEEDTESSASSGEEMVEDEEDEEVCSEVEESMSSEDEETDSSEESESSEDSELDSIESGEIVMGRVGRTVETDDETESSEESDPSSMTEEDVSESDDSQSDSACNTEQTNCLTPIMQENLSIEKKIL